MKYDGMDDESLSWHYIDVKQELSDCEFEIERRALTAKYSKGKRPKLVKTKKAAKKVK